MICPPHRTQFYSLKSALNRTAPSAEGAQGCAGAEMVITTYNLFPSVPSYVFLFTIFKLFCRTTNSKKQLLIKFFKKYKEFFPQTSSSLKLPSPTFCV